MTESDSSERLNSRGMELSDAGDVAGAEKAYHAAVEAAPEWSAPAYNLGLLYKYERRWQESLEWNQLATALAPDSKAAWWNLGIAATALGEWSETRRAWRACGIDMPLGDGPPQCDFGHAPVRLEPQDAAELVWAERLDPARARISSIPLPTSRFHWGDVVLTDGAPMGKRIVAGHSYSVFDVLQLLVPAGFRTFVLELATTVPEALMAFEQCATDHGGAAEDWGTSTEILCAECSRGTPHEHDSSTSVPAHPHWGLAARDHAHADEIITSWLTSTANSDLTRWYEAPRIQ